MNTEFQFDYTKEGCLRELRNKNDVYEMNWAAGEILWGTAEMPEGISVRREHGITERGTLEEHFIFRNESPFPVYFKGADIGIYVSLPDSYEDAGECMVRHCHTHLWCGLEAAWIMALRMNGKGPHLGIALRKGSIGSYSICRNVAKSSNDRGSFLLHPAVEQLMPGETCELQWELFWFGKRIEFREKLLEYENMPIAEIKQCTYFPGETGEITVSGKGNPGEITVDCEGMNLVWEKESDGKNYCIKVQIPMEAPGSYSVCFKINGIHTRALLYCTPALEQLVEKRCSFIAEKHQETQGHLQGGYLIYDNETKRRYYSHLDDHNGGRERVGMGALLALWLQTHENNYLENSLQQYTEYVYRELLNTETGDVYNDICHNHDWDRLYNYPWMAVFLMEIYKWKKNPGYLTDACRVMLRYYEKGGKDFYAIGIPAEELIGLLRDAGMGKTAEQLTQEFLEHAENVRNTGLDFPKSEVNYEQSIVAPAVSILLQAYGISRKEKYKAAAEELLEVLELFNGQQPDYHMFENAIRHWDGYWFGKRRCFGDTFPHYWSVLTGAEYLRYGSLFNERDYLQRGEASLRGCLNLFGEDGSASCAMVYPVSINGMQGHYYDPWANDQDWALYYAWKLRRTEERKS